ncbi:sigma 54-interacting transcriptional regulator [Rummeliibacillus sp. JY-2-4R]
MVEYELIESFGIYQTHQNLKDVLNDFVGNSYQYGIVIDKNHKIVGFFSNQLLLKLVIDIGLENIEKAKELGSFTASLSKNFQTLIDTPSSKELFKDQVDLYMVQVDGYVNGLIDYPRFLQYLTKELQFEKHHFDTVFNAVPSGVISVNIEGNITMMNPAAEKISGVKRDKAIGQFITDMVSPKGLLRVLQTGIGHIEKYRVGNRWYVSYREPIYDGKQLVGAVGVFDDISKIEKLSTELATIQQLVKENKTLLENSLDGVAIADGKGSILQQNNLFHQMHLALMVNKEQQLKFYQTIDEVIHSQTPCQYDALMNNNLCYRFRFNPIKEEEKNQLQQIFVRIQDITEQTNMSFHLTNYQKISKHFLQSKRIEPFIHVSKEMKEVASKLKKIVKVNAPVLIQGEIGTGRSTIANQIVIQSDRKEAPFIIIDCKSKRKQELENILFSPMLNQLLSILNGGTIYFKNIDFLPLSLQERLADLLSQQAINTQQGFIEKIHDIRIISSISQEISFIGEAPFSERLYYLINAMTIIVPTLQERPEDTHAILGHLIDLLSEKYDRDIVLTKEALQFITSRKWVYNLAEIKELLEQCIRSNSTTKIDISLLSDKIRNAKQTTDKPIVVNQLMPLKLAKEVMEKELIELVRKQNISYRKMAKILEVNPSTIIRKVQKLALDK